MPMDADAGRALRRPARWTGFQRIIWILSGELTQETEAPRPIRAGDFVVFSGTNGYAYVNLGAESLHFVRNVIS